MLSGARRLTVRLNRSHSVGSLNREIECVPEAQSFRRRKTTDTGVGRRGMVIRSRSIILQDGTSHEAVWRDVKIERPFSGPSSRIMDKESCLASGIDLLSGYVDPCSDRYIGSAHVCPDEGVELIPCCVGSIVDTVPNNPRAAGARVPE